MYIFVWCVCVYVCMCVGSVHACGSPRLTLGVFLGHASSLFFRIDSRTQSLLRGFNISTFGGWNCQQAATPASISVGSKTRNPAPLAHTASSLTGRPISPATYAIDFRTTLSLALSALINTWPADHAAFRGSFISHLQICRGAS